MELDKNIKNKLNSRAIQPSTNSWDRMDAMLSLQEKPKKKSFAIYYVAASLFLMLVVGFWFANENATNFIPENNGIVTTNDATNQNENSENTIEDKKEIFANDVEQVVINSEKEEAKSTIFSKVNQKKGSNKTALNSNQNTTIKKQNNSVANNVQKQKSTSNYITAAMLLASLEENPEQEINNPVILSNKKAIKVNANSLLSSVDKEMNESYRETSFEKIKRNLNEVKVAVINRNYE